MWYAIFLGIGLLVGIGFMIWALIERKKRYEAENMVEEIECYRREAVTVANNNREATLKAMGELSKSEALVAMLYKQINDLKAVIVNSDDADVIKNWLKEQLKA